MLAGIMALVNIPVEQYPNIAPPSVSIQTQLPGASAETLENSVTQVVEQSLTGIDDMRYFSSSSDSDGNVNITITFDLTQIQILLKCKFKINFKQPYPSFRKVFNNRELQ
jgi:multidrug efflux pump subunit AcrB